jgi:hypothetical protein
MVENTDTDSGSDSESPGRNTKRAAESGQYASQYSTDTIIETLERGDVVGTQDVADALGCVYDTAYKRLRKLEDEGRVRSQKVANTRIWELADVREDEDEPDQDRDGDVREDEPDGEDPSGSMPTVEDGLNPDAVTKDYVGDGE